MKKIDEKVYKMARAEPGISATAISLNIYRDIESVEDSISRLVEQGLVKAEGHLRRVYPKRSAAESAFRKP